MIPILYEDSDLIVCVKPVGILSQPDMGNGEDMIALLQSYLKEKNEKPYIGLVHRLDRNVGGVMVFPKKQAATAKISQTIRQRDFIKEYLAVVHNRPDEKAGIYKDLLFKDSSKNKTFVVNRPRKGVKEASLEYEVLGTQNTTSGEFSLLKIRLHTGRTHQIRVQFASRKMPLVGDGKYGGSDNQCDIALWSYRLSFQHPAKPKSVDVRQLPPDQYPWNLFKITDR